MRAEISAPLHVADGSALHINGVAFSLSHHPLIDNALLFIHADFGLLPEGRELAAALALLEANMFLANGSAPVFSVAPNTKQVVMVQHCALSKTDDRMLLALLTNLAEHALQWRVDYFLNSATNPFCLSKNPHLQKHQNQSHLSHSLHSFCATKAPYATQTPHPTHSAHPPVSLKPIPPDC